MCGLRRMASSMLSPRKGQDGMFHAWNLDQKQTGHHRHPSDLGWGYVLQKLSTSEMFFHSRMIVLSLCRSIDLVCQEMKDAPPLGAGLRR